MVYNTVPAWPKREVRKLCPGPSGTPKHTLAGVHRHHGHQLGQRWRRDPVLSPPSDYHRRGTKTVVFEEAKTSADCVKRTILGKAGSPDIDVAVWELTTNFSGCPKIPSLNPLVDGVVTKFGHPSASTLGLVIAPLKKPQYEGTVGLYKRRGNVNDGVLA